MRKIIWLGVIFGVLIALSLFLPQLLDRAHATTFTEIQQRQVAAASPDVATYNFVGITAPSATHRQAEESQDEICVELSG